MVIQFSFHVDKSCMDGRVVGSEGVEEETWENLGEVEECDPIVAHSTHSYL